MVYMAGWAASNMFLEFCTIEALNLRPGSKELEAFNVERVRGYLECNLGCKKKEVIHALGLHPRTVAKAIKIIRANAHRSYGVSSRDQDHRAASPDDALNRLISTARLLTGTSSMACPSSKSLFAVHESGSGPSRHIADAQ